ncbi:hypothetical protein ACVWW6_000433 [Bradyrhizobium sp. USDA 3311]|uniref:hypothetical protein n=1 Tax=Bradyrhizobium sp. LCT2 TaxID=2493093 RepID=UPI001373AF49|nr:hypothetical protein [Bradyrhizobium sp. LCT2]QHP67871.1 hypothetical protein EI171_11075 [Bradyrhizobium sp. LCT2]
MTDNEIALLDELISDVGNRRCRPGTLAFYLTKLERLGRYLARAADPPPGNVVIWRGLSRLTVIEFGAEIGAAGNVVLKAGEDLTRRRTRHRGRTLTDRLADGTVDPERRS